MRVSPIDSTWEATSRSCSLSSSLFLAWAGTIVRGSTRAIVTSIVTSVVMSVLTSAVTGDRREGNTSPG